MDQDASGLRPDGLGQEVGADRVDKACTSALAHEAVNVGLIGRMLERATENNPASDAPASAGAVVAGRFAREPGEFATPRRSTGTEGGDR